MSDIKAFQQPIDDSYPDSTKVIPFGSSDPTNTQDNTKTFIGLFKNMWQFATGIAYGTADVLLKASNNLSEIVGIVLAKINLNASPQDWGQGVEFYQNITQGGNSFTSLTPVIPPTTPGIRSSTNKFIAVQFTKDGVYALPVNTGSGINFDSLLLTGMRLRLFCSHSVSGGFYGFVVLAANNFSNYPQPLYLFEDDSAEVMYDGATWIVLSVNKTKKKRIYNSGLTQGTQETPKKIEPTGFLFTLAAYDIITINPNADGWYRLPDLADDPGLYNGYELTINSIGDSHNTTLDNDNMAWNNPANWINLGKNVNPVSQPSATFVYDTTNGTPVWRFINCSLDVAY